MMNLLFVQGYTKRNGELHRERCFEWKGLQSAERADFFASHGTRWSELSRLPYFDLVTQSVVDPMHNLLLGKPSLAISSFV